MVTIPIADIQTRKEISKTNNATVWTARWGSQDVILKVPLEKRKTEAEILEKANHPNIVKLHGTIVNSPYSMVFEYLPEGDLNHFLETHNQPGIALAQKMLREAILIDILKGLVFLHAINIVHRDLKPANIFLMAGLHAKIGDFGHAREVDSETGLYISKGADPTGTYAYIAPETFKEKVNGMCVYRLISDMYGFGMVALQVGSDSMKYIYPDAKKDHVQLEKLNREHTLPVISQEVSHETRGTFFLCYDADPARRIGSKDLLNIYESRKVMYETEDRARVAPDQRSAKTLTGL